MKKLLPIIASLAMIFSVSASGLGFHDGVDDQTVLYQDIVEHMKRDDNWDASNPKDIKDAKHMYDDMIKHGYDPNKTMKGNGCPKCYKK